MSKSVILMMAFAFAFTTCQNRITKNERNNSEKTEPSAIINSTIINKDGLVLKQTFNNTDGTCELELNGEKIELNQERMASGIKYSNEQYVYTNWHGETRLFKDGKLIFSHDE